MKFGKKFHEVGRSFVTQGLVQCINHDHGVPGRSIHGRERSPQQDFELFVRIRGRDVMYNEADSRPAGQRVFDLNIDVRSNCRA